jgi:uncharacterized membrane protein/YHS domain-containing protein
MVFFFVTIVHAFVPAAFLAGLVASRSDGPTRAGSRIAVLCVLCGWGLAWIAFALASRHRGMVEATTVFRIASIAVTGGALALVLVRRRNLPAAMPAASLAVLFVLPADGLFDVLSGTIDRPLSVTGVINTELIVNLAAIATAGVLTTTLAPLVAHGARGAGTWALALATAALGLDMLAAAGEVMLGLLQLDVIEATSARISLVATIGRLGPFVPYAYLAAAALIGCTRFLRRPRQNTPDSPPAARRKTRALTLAESRWLRGTVAAAGVLIGMLAYHDLYASQPPRLSDAVPVTAGADDAVAIAVDDVKDGRLHRFAFVTSDGHRVRFFLINRRTPERPRIGVVLDACMLCGDDGYIQVGNEVICVACNVRIHVPSIGTAGGCNPIPLAHSVDEGTIRIAVDDLEQGARFFTEVVTIEVRDPVSGARLTNTAAAFQDSHDGRVLFFAGKDTYDAFRADPDKYVPRRQRPETHNDGQE